MNAGPFYATVQADVNVTSSVKSTSMRSVHLETLSTRPQPAYSHVAHSTKLLQWRHPVGTMRDGQHFSETQT